MLYSFQSEIITVKNTLNELIKELHKTTIVLFLDYHIFDKKLTEVLITFATFQKSMYIPSIPPISGNWALLHYCAQPVYLLCFKVKSLTAPYTELNFAFALP